MDRLTIGCVLSDIYFPMDDTQYVAHAWRCLHEAILLNGHWVVSCAHRVFDSLGLVAEGQLPPRLDGVAMIAPAPNDALLRDALSRRLPLALIGTRLRLNRCDCVDVDNRRVGHIAGELFLKAGHDRVAFVTSAPTQVSSMERHAGLLAAYREAGRSEDDVLYMALNDPVPLDEPSLDEDLRANYLRTEHFGWQNNPGVFDRFLRRLLDERVTAIFAFNDQDARMYTDRLMAAGVKVPSEMSIIGVDNVGRFVLGNPRLSSIGQNVPQICRVAVRLLLARIQHPDAEPQTVLVPPVLHDRGSVAPPSRRAA
ncbi:MAG: substrate-binding domain-containing protein [Fimbriimonadales bacterium]|nr:substrate-binding domain-containing protein [Fimbriimonadales bacterium]